MEDYKFSEAGIIQENGIFWRPRNKPVANLSQAEMFAELKAIEQKTRTTKKLNTDQEHRCLETLARFGEFLRDFYANKHILTKDF